MIPRHFALEVADRCDTLIEQCWQAVSRPPVPGDPRGPMTTTFLLAMAMPMIVIPYERLLKHGATDDKARLGRRAQDVRWRLNVPSRDIPAFADTRWHHYVTGHPLTRLSDVAALLRDGLDSEAGTAARTQALDTQALRLITGLRHALAHGTAAYLDDDCRMTDGQVQVIAFTSEDRDRNGRFIQSNVYVIREHEFRAFLGRWAEWLRAVASPADLHRFYAEPPAAGRQPAANE